MKYTFFALNQYVIVLVDDAGGIKNCCQSNGEYVWESELDLFLDLMAGGGGE